MGARLTEAGVLDRSARRVQSDGRGTAGRRRRRWHHAATCKALVRLRDGGACGRRSRGLIRRSGSACAARMSTGVAGLAAQAAVAGEGGETRKGLGLLQGRGDGEGAGDRGSARRGAAAGRDPGGAAYRSGLDRGVRQCGGRDRGARLPALAFGHRGAGNGRAVRRVAQGRDAVAEDGRYGAAGRRGRNG